MVEHETQTSSSFRFDSGLMCPAIAEPNSKMSLASKALGRQFRIWVTFGSAMTTMTIHVRRSCSWVYLCSTFQFVFVRQLVGSRLRMPVGNSFYEDDDGASSPPVVAFPVPNRHTSIWIVVAFASAATILLVGLGVGLAVGLAADGGTSSAPLATTTSAAAVLTSFPVSPALLDDVRASLPRASVLEAAMEAPNRTPQFKAFGWLQRHPREQERRGRRRRMEERQRMA
jgi:hypothetical protein